jgi:hypothetical protein
MVEILLGVLAQHLALMAANWALDNNFGSRSRRSVHIGWCHPLQATRSKAVLQHESTWPRYLKAFPEGKTHTAHDFRSSA